MSGNKNLATPDQSEHIGDDTTGDNIQAKRVANYDWDGANWNRGFKGLLTLPYDEIDKSNPDPSGNYRTLTTKLAGVTQQSLTLAYDGSNNITSIVRN